MFKRYKTTTDTVIEGKQFREGQELRLAEEKAAGYLKAKLLVLAEGETKPESQKTAKTSSAHRKPQSKDA